MHEPRSAVRAGIQLSICCVCTVFFFFFTTLANICFVHNNGRRVEHLKSVTHVSGTRKTVGIINLYVIINLSIRRMAYKKKFISMSRIWKVCSLFVFCTPIKWKNYSKVYNTASDVRKTDHCAFKLKTRTSDCSDDLVFRTCACERIQRMKTITF